MITMVNFSLLFASILILCKVNHAEYWGGFQYYKYVEWPGLDGKGYYQPESVILDLFHPHIHGSPAILHRASVDSTWRVTSASNFLRSKINIHYGTGESAPINTLDLEHIDGAFFRCHIGTHTIFIQFIFDSSNWDIKQRISGGDPLPITDHGHTDASKYGDVDTWWQVMHNKGPEPYYINQGLDAKCPLNALNVLLQGPDITDKEMTTVQEEHGWSSITLEDAKRSGTAFLAYSASITVGGVWNGKVFPIVEEKRHIRPKYKFAKGEKIEIYNRKYISEREGFEEEIIGHLVMKLENEKFFIYNKYGETLRRLDGSGELVLHNFRTRVVEKPKYRFVTVSEMWGHEYVEPGYFSPTVHKLVDENADQYVELISGVVCYYDNRDPDPILYRFGIKPSSTKLYDSTELEENNRTVVFNPEYHKSIHFPVTNPAHERVLKMGATPIYENEENLPYNLLGFYLLRPGHALSYRKVGAGWYNLDSAFGMMGCTINREAKTWREMRELIIKQLSYESLLIKPHQVTLVVRSPDFVPAAPAPVALGMPISSRLLSYLPETKYKPNTNMIDNMINILEKEEEMDLKLFVVMFMIIGLISAAIVWIYCFMVGFLATYFIGDTKFAMKYMQRN